MIVQFAIGYFRYFDISFALVNFVPQMYDYIRISLLSLILTGVLLAMTYALMQTSSRLGEFAANRIPTPKKIDNKVRELIEKHREGTGRLIKALNFIIKFLIAGSIVITFLVIVFVAMPKIGYESAKSTTQLTSISDSESTQQEVIVYKGSEGIITKTFNLETQSYEEGYSFKPNFEYKARTIDVK